MAKETKIREFIGSVRGALPAAAAEADGIMRGRGFDSGEEAPYLWVEALAEVTNTLIRWRSEEEATKHLNFFSEQFERGTTAIRECIDVSYVENLMENMPPADKRWAWPLIPDNLKELYIAMWGRPEY